MNYTGTTSLEVGIKVITENIQAHLVRHANSCFFTMVAVDDEGKPTVVPPLRPSTPDEVRRFEGAKVRRELRRELEARIGRSTILHKASSSLGEMVPANKPASATLRLSSS